MPMIYRKSPKQVAEAQRKNQGIDPSEGPEEKIKPVSVIGGGQGGSLIAFTQGTSVGHGR
jgi:hypothetical protein